MAEITKNMGITDVVMQYPDAVPVFQKYGMHCLGCAAARFENVEEGCLAHGIDPDAMVRDINAAISQA